MAEIVKVQVEAGLAVVTIDRPEALNALNDETLAGLEAAFITLGNDKSVRAVILTGAGKAFVAGADIKAMAGFSAVEARSFAHRGQRIFNLIEEFPHPVIAAVSVGPNNLFFTSHTRQGPCGTKVMLCATRSASGPKRSLRRESR